MKASADSLLMSRSDGYLLEGVFAICDRGRFPCADFTDLELQNAYLEGYTQKVEVTNLFVWNFYGEIIHAAMNFPGSWHDSRLAYISGLIHDKLSDKMMPPGFAILCDSAFVKDTKRTNGKLLEVERIMKNLLAPIPRNLQLCMQSSSVSCQVSANLRNGEFGV